jgi:hypothetical protein
MKKKYIYFAPPIVALALFVVYYMHFLTGYNLKQEQVVAAARKEKEETVRLQNEQRKKAVDEAVAASERHKKEKAEKDAIAAKRAEDMQNASQAREKALSDLIKYRERVAVLKKDVATIKEEIAKIEQEEGLYKGQATFLEDYVAKAQANSADLDKVLEKIKAADEAKAAAARAAAAAAKKAASS